MAQRSPDPHLCLSLALRNQKENKNKTRLITIQQYKSQTAKTPNGKLKNKDEMYWDFSDEKRWRLRTKGDRKRGKSVAVITDIEGKKIWDELGFFLGVGSCGLFNLWTKNWKFKKIKLQAWRIRTRVARQKIYRHATMLIRTKYRDENWPFNRQLCSNYTVFIFYMNKY